MFKDNSLEEQIDMLFGICDVKEEGAINAEDLKKMFLKNLNTDDEKKAVKYLYKDFYKEINPKNENGITKKDFYSLALKDQNIRQIIEKNTKI